MRVYRGGRKLVEVYPASKRFPDEVYHARTCLQQQPLSTLNLAQSTLVKPAKGNCPLLLERVNRACVQARANVP